MSKIVITSGQPFTDIDALACAIAYAELLNNLGKDAKAVLPGPLNKSVTEEIENWDLKFETSHKNNDGEYILVDISNPDYFAEFVDLEKVIEIFDHRTGFVDYWENRLKKASHIEMVGACATLIWEEFKKNKKERNITKISANLLYTAIISNTLNFQANITDNRDKNAFKELTEYVDLPENWLKNYFTDQDKETEKYLRSAIINDTKNIKPIIAQLELWDSKRVILDRLDEIDSVMQTFNTENWFLTSPSISEGKNYIYTKNEGLKNLLKKTIKAKFESDIGITDRLWLRKEILRELNNN